MISLSQKKSWRGFHRLAKKFAFVHASAILSTNISFGWHKTILEVFAGTIGEGAKTSRRITLKKTSLFCSLQFWLLSIVQNCLRSLGRPHYSSFAFLQNWCEKVVFFCKNQEQPKLLPIDYKLFIRQKTVDASVSQHLIWTFLS